MSECKTTSRPFLQGERVYLRALCKSDLDGPYLDWLNDAEVCAGNSHHVVPLTHGQASRFIADSVDRHRALHLAIVLRDGDRHIGNVALQRIDWVSRSAELSILIGEKDFWGQGYGKECCHILIEHGFRAMNLNRIYLGTYSNNHGMVRVAEALGMKLEGQRREAAFKNGSYLDVLEFGLLKAESEQQISTAERKEV